jgi:hypothetical protein
MGHKQRDLLAEVRYFFLPGGDVRGMQQEAMEGEEEGRGNLHSRFFLLALAYCSFPLSTRSDLAVLIGPKSLAFEEGWLAGGRGATENFQRLCQVHGARGKKRRGCRIGGGQSRRRRRSGQEEMTVQSRPGP